MKYCARLAQVFIINSSKSIKKTKGQKQRHCLRHTISFVPKTVKASPWEQLKKQLAKTFAISPSPSPHSSCFHLNLQPWEDVRPKPSTDLCGPRLLTPPDLPSPRISQSATRAREQCKANVKKESVILFERATMLKRLNTPMFNRQNLQGCTVLVRCDNNNKKRRAILWSV